MTYYKTLKSILLSLCFIGSNSIYAAPATDATVNKYIQLSELDKRIETYISALKPYFDEKTEQYIHDLKLNEKLNANDVSSAHKLSQKMLEVSQKTLQSHQTRELIKQVYQNSYTEEEIQAYNSFLGTPEGKSFFRKNDAVISKVQAILEDLILQELDKIELKKML